jgi:HSP20 family protein
MVSIRHAGRTGFGRTLDQLFQDVLGGWQPALPAFSSTPLFPALNLWQDEAAFHLEAELPGVQREDLELALEGREFRLSGERKRVEGSKPIHDERAFGRFERRLRLPDDVNPEGVSADLREGVLHVTLPKAAHAKPLRIEIQQG